MISVRSVPADLLIVGAELMTGKSIPVIVAIARLPMDQVLAWVMLCMGAVAGTLFSVYSSRIVSGMTVLGFVNRAAQLGFSTALSLSLLLSIAQGIHAERGVALSIIPAFCVVAQALPQRDSTATVSFILNFAAFYVCMVTVAWAQPETRGLVLVPHVTVAWAQPETHGLVLVPRTTLSDEAASVGLTVGRALQLFSLAFYACIQHAPTAVYFGMDPPTTVRPPIYASHHLARHAHYSLFIALIAAWLRLCVWSSVCFFQDNFMHVILEAAGGPEWDWFGCFVYATALLYSACWTATQLREQVMPRLFHTETDRLKAGVCVLVLAALLRQGDDQAMFVTANALTVLCLATTVLTIKTHG